MTHTLRCEFPFDGRIPDLDHLLEQFLHHCAKNLAKDTASILGEAANSQPMETSSSSSVNQFMDFVTSRPILILSFGMLVLCIKLVSCEMVGLQEKIKVLKEEKRNSEKFLVGMVARLNESWEESKASRAQGKVEGENSMQKYYTERLDELLSVRGEDLKSAVVKLCRAEGLGVVEWKPRKGESEDDGEADVMDAEVSGKWEKL